MDQHPNTLAEAKRVSFLPYLVIGLLLIGGAGALFARAQTSDSSVPSTPSANIGPESTSQSTTTNGTTIPVQEATSPTNTSNDSSSGTSGLGAFSTGTTTMPNLPLLGATPAPMVVSIENSGNALIRGVVQSVTATEVTIATWGGVWTIRSAGEGATTVLPTGPSGSSDMSSIMVGHFVGAEGIITLNEPMTINAAFVRDWTTNPYRGVLLNGFGATTSPSGSTADGTNGTGTTTNGTNGSTSATNGTSPSLNSGTTSGSAATTTNGTNGSTGNTTATSSPAGGAGTNGSSGVLPFF